jgi:hypothetical protein
MDPPESVNRSKPNKNGATWKEYDKCKSRKGAMGDEHLRIII